MKSLPAGGCALWRIAHAHKGGFATPYCVRRREVIWIFGGTEKIQMTAAWDSQNAFRRRRKGGRAIAVTMASAKKVRRQKF